MEANEALELINQLSLHKGLQSTEFLSEKEQDVFDIIWKGHNLNPEARNNPWSIEDYPKLRGICIRKYASKFLYKKLKKILEIKDITKFNLKTAVEAKLKKLQNSEKEQSLELKCIEDQKIFLPEPYVNEEVFNSLVKFTLIQNAPNQLKQWLPGDNNCQKIVIISGTPGVGKSVLACNYALENKEDFPDGIYGIRLNEENNQASNQDFINEVSKVLISKILPKKTLNQSSDYQATIRKYLADRQVLLILDNVENEDGIKSLCSGLNCSIILTTTNKYLWQDLENSQLLELKLPNEDQAVEILKNHVGECRRKEIEQNKSIAKEIVKLIGNLPLAIPIIAKSLERSWSDKILKTFLENLQDDQARFLQLIKTQNQRNNDVWYSFAFALKDLQNENQDIFACIGACAKAGFSLEVIKHTAGNENKFTIASTEVCLRNLAEHYFVKNTEDYFMPMHNLIHDFARNVLENKSYSEYLNISEDICKNAKSNHAQYFLKLVNQSYNLPIPRKICNKYSLGLSSAKGKSNYQDIIDKLKFNYDNLIVAAQWSAKAENFNEDSYHFIFSSIFRDFLYQNRKNEQYTDLVKEFEEAVEQQQVNKDCKNYIELELRDRNSYSEKEKDLKERFEKVEKVKQESNKINSDSEDSRDYIKWCKLQFSRALFWLYIDKARKKSLNIINKSKNLEKAEEYLEYIDRLFQTLDEKTKYSEAENFNVLKSRFHFYKAEANDFSPSTKDDLQTALEFAEKTLEDLAHQPNEILFLTDMRLGHLGEILLNLGKFFKQENPQQAQQNLEDAEQYLKDSLEISKVIKHLHGSAIVFKNLGKTYKELIDLRDSEKESFFEQAKECFWQSYDQDRKISYSKIPRKSESITELLDLYDRQNKDLQEIINEISERESNEKVEQIKRLIITSYSYLKPIKNKAKIHDEFLFLGNKSKGGKIS